MPIDRLSVDADSRSSAEYVRESAAGQYVTGLNVFESRYFIHWHGDDSAHVHGAKRPVGGLFGGSTTWSCNASISGRRSGQREHVQQLHVSAWLDFAADSLT